MRLRGSLVYPALLLAISSVASAFTPLSRQNRGLRRRRCAPPIGSATAIVASRIAPGVSARSAAYMSPVAGDGDKDDASPPHHAEEEKGRSAGSGVGDALRASTGIRPSLHPATINAISDALLLRASVGAKRGDDDADEQPIDAWADGSEPLAVALTAGRIASEALERRAASCRADGDEGSIPTAEECQTVAGRVVGVVMRMRDLEEELATRAGMVGWVRKYREYGTFGVLKSECDVVAEADAGGGEEAEEIEGEPSDGWIGGEDSRRTIDPERERELRDKVRDDPLFRMCRAECLLALFIHSVEAPQLEKAGQDVAGGSEIDFIDEDRKEVLLA